MIKAYLIGVYKSDKLVSMEVFSEPAESITRSFTQSMTYKTIDFESGNSFEDARIKLVKKAERLFKGKTK